MLFNETGKNEEECLEKDEDDICVRCAVMILHPSRTCTRLCKSNDVRLRLNDEKYKGRVCHELPKATSGNEIIIIIGICSAIIIFLFVAIAIGIHINNKVKKKKNCVSSHRKQQNDDGDKEFFIMKVRQLKPLAPILLEILNKTRKRYQSINREMETVKSKALKSYMRDLGRILLIVNLHENKIKVPPDGRKLILWTEKVLSHHRNKGHNGHYKSEGHRMEIKSINGFHSSQLKNGQEVRVDVENTSTGDGQTSDEDDDLFGTYMLRCEDGTAIMTTEL